MDKNGLIEIYNEAYKIMKKYPSYYFYYFENCSIILILSLYIE